jgi:hypothetical protein
MSKPSRRPARELRKARLKEQKALRQRQRAEGLEPPRQVSIPNRKSDLNTVEEEKQARQDTLVSYAQVIRPQLPTLLKRLAKIPDPRDPKKTRHQMTTLLIFGMLTFVFHMSSRREANRRMTRPVFMDNLRRLFPELDDLPHHDTLYRLLAQIDVAEIEAAHLDLFRRLVRKKKFRPYLIEQCYPIAIDGTQKFARDYPWADEALERPVGRAEQGATQYYVFVAEASLALRNGMVLPLMSEFLRHTAEEEDEDCEQKALKRLAERLKRAFPRLPIMLLLDGLYPNGTVMEICRRYHWQFMIVVKDKTLPSVWSEAQGLRPYQSENRRQQPCGDRWQRFWWVNDIEYTYGPNERRRLTIHFVVCEESWEEVGPGGEVQTHKSRHAWVSSHPLSHSTIHERCNLGARHRWGVEANILVEKHQGYRYEHSFAYQWTAMKGYHYLMRLGHFLNVLACYSKSLRESVRSLGVRGLIDFLRETLAGPWLDPGQVHARLAQRVQLRFG